MAVAGWWRRRRFACAGLLLYTIIASGIMAPLASREIPSTPAQDLCNHVSGIIEARRALAEGQFPIRVAPDQNQQTRYPIFQFYGNLPYTLGGAAYLATNGDPYRIWKLEVIAFLVLGGLYTYRLARMFTRQPLAALAAGSVFITAPYVLTDIHGRYAFPEIVSFMLLPAVFYYSMRCFVVRRLGPILAGGVSWSALILSHNVTFLYAGIYFGLFFLSWFKPRRKTVFRGLRVGAALALGLVLTAWSIVPQLILVPDLCYGLHTDVFKNGWLTPLGVLLAPSVTLPVHVPTIYIGEPQHFGLQVGWPILAAVGLSMWHWRSPQASHHGRRAVMTRMLVLFGLAFLMTWMPFDLWRALPDLFNYVQFSYRLLMFVVLWGSLLAAYALTLALEGRMRPIHLAAIVIGLGWTAGPYMAPHKTEPHITVAQEIAHPEMGRGGAGATYAMSAAKLAQTTLLHPDIDWPNPATGGLLDTMEYYRYGRIYAAFPGPRPGDALRLEGTVSPDVKAPLRLAILVDGAAVATPELSPGPFQLTVPLPSAPDKQRIIVAVQGDPILTPSPPPHPTPFRKASFTLNHLAMQTEHKPMAPASLLPAETVRAQMLFGNPTTLRVETAQPSMVQLPVVYYPGMLHVDVDGRHVRVQHLGRYVAVELPPGQHVVTVRFVGVVWANALSSIAWTGVALFALALAARRFIRLRGMKPTRRTSSVMRILRAGLPRTKAPASPIPSASEL
ncbi:MAG TPA: 6-pyruvoyl-tetrahydropterin synthase-related protein [Gemmataceae bacterium]|nr:6-pyruvoyl-tetrahydropterin synthase-related protein [Gemmataceae bacterium]